MNGLPAMLGVFARCSTARSGLGRRNPRRLLATESTTKKFIPPPPERETSALARFLRASFFVVGVGFIAYLLTVDPEDIKKAHRETLDDMKSLERLTEEVQRKTLENNNNNNNNSSSNEKK